MTKLRQGYQIQLHETKNMGAWIFIQDMLILRGKHRVG